MKEIFCFQTSAAGYSNIYRIHNDQKVTVHLRLCTILRDYQYYIFIYTWDVNIFKVSLEKYYHRLIISQFN